MTAVTIGMWARGVGEELEILADLEFQQRIWIRAERPEIVYSWDDSICNLVDGWNLELFMKEDDVAPHTRLVESLQQLIVAIDDVPDEDPDEVTILSPEWSTLRERAARAHQELVKSGLMEGD